MAFQAHFMCTHLILNFCLKNIVFAIYMLKMPSISVQHNTSNINEVCRIFYSLDLLAHEIRLLLQDFKELGTNLLCYFFVKT